MNHRNEYDLKTIGKNLRRLREACNLTVDDVREYLYLGSVQAVYKYERGMSYPKADTLLALMELYGASLTDLTTDYTPHIVNDYEGDLESPSVVFRRQYLFAFI